MTGGKIERKIIVRNDVVKVLADVRDARTGQVTAEQHAADPQGSAKDVVEKVGRVAHLRRTSDRGAERANDGNEARQNHGAAAIFLVKLMGPLQVAATEEKGVFAAIESRTRRTPNPVAELVTNDGAQDAWKKQPAQGNHVLAGEDARGDQQGVAGKKKANEEPGFHEDDGANERGSSPAD